MRVHRLLETFASIEPNVELHELLIPAQKFAMGTLESYADENLWSFTQGLSARGLLRLPFPYTYFEFKAGQGTPFETIGCLVWMASGEVFVRTYLETGERWHGVAGVGVIAEGAFGHGESEAEASVDPEMPIKAAILVAGAIAALSARTTRVDRVEIDPEWNRARRRRRQIPLSDHHVVRLNGVTTTFHGGSAGTPRSYRLHWRRGHFRRRYGRTFPVSPCLVGAGSSEFITHEYRFDPAFLNADTETLS